MLKALRPHADAPRSVRLLACFFIGLGILSLLRASAGFMPGEPFNLSGIVLIILGIGLLKLHSLSRSISLALLAFFFALTLAGLWFFIRNGVNDLTAEGRYTLAYTLVTMLMTATGLVVLLRPSVSLIFRKQQVHAAIARHRRRPA